MTPVASLPPDLQTAITGQNLVVFDGECVLCSGFFRFMLARDHSHRFSFATAQSPLGSRLYRALDLPTTDFETNLVIVDDQIFQKLDAFTAAMRTLGGVWSFLALLRFLPAVLKDPAYRAIARNRYRLFGRYDQCLVPDAAIRSRFLPDGFQI